MTEQDSNPAMPITGALLSAQISDGILASVVRSTLSSDVSGEEGRYSLLLSPGQTNNIVAYADKKVDNPGEEELYLPNCKELPVPGEGDFEQNLTLVKSDFGTIFGNVSFSGEIDPGEPPVIYISFFTTFECCDNDYIEVTSLQIIPNPETGVYAYIVDLPVGTYEVVASCEGFDPKTETAVELTSGIQVNINFAF